MRRLGIAHHYGWAIAVTADDGALVDRRRIELIEPGLPAAPIHHEGGAHEMHRHGEPPSDDELAALVASVRASVVRTTAASFDTLPDGIASISLRAWPADFPTDIATLRLVPYEARADSVMYRQVLAEVALGRGWTVHRFEANDVDALAATLTATHVGVGAPWTKDHRTALAATIVANRP